MSVIVLVLEGRVRDGMRPPLEAFLREARPYYESIGDVQMRVLWDEQDPLRFREEFTYLTEQAYLADDDRVRTDPEMQRWLTRWRTFLDGDVTVSVWRPVDLNAPES